MGTSIEKLCPWIRLSSPNSRQQTVPGGQAHTPVPISKEAQKLGSPTAEPPQVGDFWLNNECLNGVFLQTIPRKVKLNTIYHDLNIDDVHEHLFEVYGIHTYLEYD